jgi:hypothetical protein
MPVSAGTTLALMAALLAAACRSPSSDGTAPRPEATAAGLRGRVTVAGKGVEAAEVLVVRGGQVVAVLKAAPDFEVPPELASACGELRWLVRLASPAGLVPARPPASCAGAFEVAVAASQVVALRGTIVAPPGGSLDWVDVKLTPLLTDVDPALVLADGATTDLREALSIQRITATSFELPVLAGRWRLAADRTIDAPVGTRPGNLRLDALTSTGPDAPTAQFGGYVLTVAADTAVQLTLRSADAP